MKTLTGKAHLYTEDLPFTVIGYKTQGNGRQSQLFPSHHLLRFLGEIMPSYFQDDHVS
ncbi:hypothetical protein MUCCIDRAFT_115620 [Mucor lusitanicus CBS 277.49]|uniref:Uncharacterized protein n=1 Tax=Mucor lusitanicus CBS 277.49 TaxID=747725 RepID=A0A162Q1M2_MUCCL|nr:hypothetical protein MUCCIDRAFT_115620 [Mucor lusitanicus CBS 277.49]